MKLNDKTWAKFLKWVYKSHNITKDWKPDNTSVRLWEEFKSSYLKG